MLNVRTIFSGYMIVF